MSDKTTSQRENGYPEKIQQRAQVAPAVDIFENKDEVLIVSDLPGVAKENLTIGFEKNQLTIEGRRAGEQGEEAFDFRRTFVVPGGVDADKIAASLSQGVLTLRLPKPAALKPRQIEIRSE